MLVDVTYGCRPVAGRMQSVEALLVAAHREFPNNVDAGIEYALREMRHIIVDAEQGDGEAVQEVTP